MTRIQIIVYSLAFSFFFTQNIMTFLRKLILFCFRMKTQNTKPLDFTRYNQVSKSVNRKIKPLDCLPCMTGWYCLATSIYYGYSLESILIMFLGYFIGAIFGNVMMRWL